MDPKLKAILDDIVAKIKADGPIVAPVLIKVLQALETQTTDPIAKAVIAGVVAVLEAFVPNPTPSAPAH